MQPSSAHYREAARLVRVGWCQGEYATTEFDEGVDPDDDRAVRFCAVGAVLRAAGVEGEPTDGDCADLSKPLADYLTRRYGGSTSPDDWNDAEGQTAERVAAGLDEVAAMLEAEST